MYVRKRGDRWRVEVEVMVDYERIRDAKTFDTKAEAVAWGAEREKEIARGQSRKTDYSKTFGDALLYYLENETPKKVSKKNETLRINYFLRCKELNTDVKLHSLTPEMIEKYISQRLKKVMTSTINKEISIMRSAIRVATQNRWIDHNPFEGISQLKEPPPRNRRISPAEESRILEALDYEEGIPPIQARHRVAIMFLFALETGMRIGEISDMDWNNIYIKERYLKILMSKNGDSRDVPLSSRAIELLEMMRAYSRTLIHDRSQKDEFGRVVNFRAQPVFYKDYRESAYKASAIFKKYAKQANVFDMTFHDTRHEACTRLARKIDVLDLAKMIGHRDPRSLMIYYNPTATEIADRLG